MWAMSLRETRSNGKDPEANFRKTNFWIHDMGIWWELTGHDQALERFREVASVELGWAWGSRRSRTIPRMPLLNREKDQRMATIHDPWRRKDAEKMQSLLWDLVYLCSRWFKWVEGPESLEFFNSWCYGSKVQDMLFVLNRLRRIIEVFHFFIWIGNFRTSNEFLKETQYKKVHMIREKDAASSYKRRHCRARWTTPCRQLFWRISC